MRSGQLHGKRRRSLKAFYGMADSLLLAGSGIWQGRELDSCIAGNLERVLWHGTLPNDFSGAALGPSGHMPKDCCGGQGHFINCPGELLGARSPQVGM